MGRLVGMSTRHHLCPPLTQELLLYLHNKTRHLKDSHRPGSLPRWADEAMMHACVIVPVGHSAAQYFEVVGKQLLVTYTLNDRLLGKQQSNISVHASVLTLLIPLGLYAVML